MQRTRAVVLVMCSVAIIVASWGSAATAGTAAKKKPKVSCDPKTAVADIGPLFDIEANSANSAKKQASTVQFGNQPAVFKQIKAVAASSPLKTVRAEPAGNVKLLDKRSAVGDLTITVDVDRKQEIHQGPQFYMCVGKDQNGTKKGAWRITLYSFCNLAALAPCSSDMITKGLNALTPVLRAEATKSG
jgi:hypothetical protein